MVLNFIVSAPTISDFIKYITTFVDPPVFIKAALQYTMDPRLYANPLPPYSHYRDCPWEMFRGPTLPAFALDRSKRMSRERHHMAPSLTRVADYIQTNPVSPRHLHRFILLLITVPLCCRGSFTPKKGTTTYLGCSRAFLVVLTVPILLHRRC